MDPTLSFRAELWPWRAEGATTWVMVTVPEDESDVIDEVVPDKRGFGSVRVRARFLVEEKTIEWTTSVFPSKELGCYVLPVKKAIRTKSGADVGDSVDIELDLLIT